MSTRHSHVERIKINPADVLSLFLNNFLELVYSIPKMTCSGFVYDNIAVQDWNAIKGLSFLFYFIYLFFLLAFCFALPDFLVQAAVSHARDWFRDTYSIF